jgi:cell wall-associated NlpC family hydrolase
VLTATAAAAVAISSQVASADPKPSKDQVKAQVDSLNEQAEQATEKYDAAQEQQSKLQQQVSDLENQVAREQAQLNTLRGDLGSLASAQYRNGGIDPSVQLFLSSNPSDYLEKASTLSQLSGKQADELKQLQQQQRQLDQERTEAAAKLAQLDGTRKELQQRKQDVQAKLAQAQALLNTLTAQERASLDAANRASRDSIRIDLGVMSAASQRAASALSAAEGVIGSPYVWGASGPSSFDCSGLTSWAYAQAGVSIPRTSQEQANAGTHLSMSELRPGDLVIFFGDYHHVGLYAGNGMVLHAPHSGANVRYEAMSDMTFEFGVRI